VPAAHESCLLGRRLRRHTDDAQLQRGLQQRTLGGRVDDDAGAVLGHRDLLECLEPGHQVAVHVDVARDVGAREPEFVR
jgi:hypothetical protein